LETFNRIALSDCLSLVAATTVPGRGPRNVCPLKPDARLVGPPPFIFGPLLRSLWESLPRAAIAPHPTPASETPPPCVCEVSQVITINLQ
jgi:hypothetical protein